MLGHRHPPVGIAPVATGASHPSTAAQSGGADTRASVPSAGTRTASFTTGSTSPREPYVADTTRMP
jgi:hypothetical protein